MTETTIKGAGGRGPYRIALFFALGMLAVDVLVPLIYIGNAGRADWDQFLTFHLIQEWNHHFFGFAKQWNPLLGGGMSLGGDPQTPIFSLSMILGYLAGSLAGIRLAAVFWALIGFAGAWLFSGVFFEERPVRLLAAGLFVGNGFFITHLSNGHVCHYPAFAAPAYFWLVHAADRAIRSRPQWRYKLSAAALFGLAFTPLAVISFDGSPVFPLYTFFWIFAYAVFYGAQKRSLWPLVVLGAAFVAALFVDAIYALPLVGYQSDFPRSGLASFHNPLALPIFLLVPLQGSPGPAFGLPDSAQEYSLYIGPVLAWLIHHYRRRLSGIFPPAAGRRFLWLSIFFFVIGLGSLRSSGVTWLWSPFDLLSILPGFRSIRNTTRYWGFIVIPLSLITARVVWWFLSERDSFKRWGMVAALMFIFQFAFPAGAMSRYLAGSGNLRPVNPDDYAYRTKAHPDAPGVVIEHRITGKKFRMVRNLTPATDILDCYQNMEYPRGDVRPGSFFVQSVYGSDKALDERAAGLRSRWLSFSQVKIECGEDTVLPGPDENGNLYLVFNQNYYRHWSSSAGAVFSTDSGNLALSIPADRLCPAVTVTYLDPWSALGERVSRLSLPIYLALLALALAIFLTARRRFARPA